MVIALKPGQVSLTRCCGGAVEHTLTRGLTSSADSGVGDEDPVSGVRERFCCLHEVEKKLLEFAHACMSHEARLCYNCAIACARAHTQTHGRGQTRMCATVHAAVLQSTLALQLRHSARVHVHTHRVHTETHTRTHMIP